MRLELEDSVLKRAWVLKLWDAKTRKRCKELVEREEFHEATFYLGDGVYCVSGENPPTDPDRWLRIQNNKGEWCNYRDVARLLSADNANAQRAKVGSEVIECTLHKCYQCDGTFPAAAGTEPYCRVIGWAENKPILAPICPTCDETGELGNYHEHFCYCGHEFWAEGSISDCDECRGDFNRTFSCGCKLCREYCWWVEADVEDCYEGD